MEIRYGFTTSLFSLCSEFKIAITDDDTISSVSGVNIAARQIGGAFGAAGCAALLATSGDEPDPASYALAFGLIAVLAVAALLASLLIPARQAPGDTNL